MAYPRRDDHARIYAEWHRAASERDGAALIALYADDAVLESPLVPAILESKTDGVLRGKAEIAHFLEAARAAGPSISLAGTVPTRISALVRHWCGNIRAKHRMAIGWRSSRSGTSH